MVSNGKGLTHLLMSQALMDSLPSGTERGRFELPITGSPDSKAFFRRYLCQLLT